MTAILSCKSSFVSTKWRDCIFWTSLRGIGGKAKKSTPVMEARGDRVAAGSTGEAVVGTEASDVAGDNEAREGSGSAAH